MKKRYWLMKSEPSVFSFDDLKKSPNKTTCWEGVRNYQARNLMRDEIRKGDGVLFYHSNADPPAIVGTATVVTEAYTDHYQFDSKSKYFDSKASKDSPRWIMIDIRYDRAFKQELSLASLRNEKKLSKMELLRKGSRLSVQPVSEAEWNYILKLGGLKP